MFQTSKFGDRWYIQERQIPRSQIRRLNAAFQLVLGLTSIKYWIVLETKRFGHEISLFWKDVSKISSQILTRNIWNQKLQIPTLKEALHLSNPKTTLRLIQIACQDSQIWLVRIWRLDAKTSQVRLFQPVYGGKLMPHFKTHLKMSQPFIYHPILLSTRTRALVQIEISGKQLWKKNWPIQPVRRRGIWSICRPKEKPLEVDGSTRPKTTKSTNIRPVGQSRAFYKNTVLISTRRF